MGRTACCVVLVCALVVAGCSGFAGGGFGSGAEGSDGGESGVSVTPAPVPAVEGANELAPGLTEEGIENASALAAAHAATLENTSFTTRSDRTITYPNGSLRQRVTGTVHVGRGGAYDARYAFARRPSWQAEDTHAITRIGYFSDGERTLQAIEFANGTTRYGDVSAELADSTRRSLTQRGGEYERLLAGAETRVVSRTTRNDSRMFGVEATNVTIGYFGSSGPRGDPRNATLWLLVCERGLVRYHRVAYTATTEANVTTRTVETVRYANPGTTRVRRPMWYDEAIERTNATDGNRTTAASRPGEIGGMGRDREPTGHTPPTKDFERAARIEE